MTNGVLIFADEFSFCAQSARYEEGEGEFAGTRVVTVVTTVLVTAW